MPATGARKVKKSGQIGYGRGKALTQCESPQTLDRRDPRSLFDAVLGEVVAERALADAHQLGGVLLDAAGAVERAADRLALDPLDVLPQLQRRQAARLRAMAAPSSRRRRAPITGPGDSTTARSMVFSSSRTLPGQSYCLQRRRARPSSMPSIALAGALRVLLRRSARPAPGCRRAARAAAASRSGSRSAGRTDLPGTCRRRPSAAGRGWSRRSRARRPSRVRSEPSGSNSRSCSTRSSFDCSAGLIVPISSRKIVPPSASANLPFLVVGRAGERAAHVAEQLRLEQRLGDRRAVHLDQRHVALRAAVVDRARHQLLAGAGLAGDEHRALGLGDQLGARLMTSCIAPAAADDAVVVELARRAR